MKTWRSVPAKSFGQVGDSVKVGSRIYMKSANGVWGLIVDKKLVSEIRNLYCVQGLNLREVASAVSDSHHVISHSLVQRVCNEQGWTRSHYGRKEASLVYLRKNKKKILRLYDKHACTLAELRYVTGVPSLSGFFSTDLGRKRSTTGMRPIKDRLVSFQKLHPTSRGSWNRILTTNPNDLTFLEYKLLVRLMTNIVYRRFYHDDHTQRSMFRHVDHILSIRDGFYKMVEGSPRKRDSVVPFKYMVHPLNMRLVSRSVNLLKGEASNHTLRQLIQKIEVSPIKLEVINRRKELRLLAKELGLERYEES